MAWTALKQAIADIIKANDNNEITGDLLQSTLHNIIDNVGSTHGFKGVATIATNPGTPDGNEFYLAATFGNYANFGLTLPSTGLYILKNTGSVWTAIEIPIISKMMLLNDVTDETVHQGDILAYSRKTSKFATKNLPIYLSKKITGAKTTITKNLYNPNDENILVDGYITETGAFQAAENYVNTGLIPVEEGENYCTTYPVALVTWWDANGKLIGNTSSASMTANKYATAPTGAKYGRFTFLKGTSYGINQTLYFTVAKGTTVVTAGNVVFPVYIPFQEIEKADKLKLIESNIPDFLVKLRNTEFFKNGKNLFNPNDTDILLGQYYNDVNVLTVNALYNQTGFIPVTAGLKYTTPVKLVSVNWYDENKQFISSTASASFTANVTAVTGAKYARFISTVVAWETFQVEQGETSTTFEQYVEYINPQFIPGNSETLIKGKKLTTFGDSITYQNKWQPFIVELLDVVHTPLGVSSSPLAMHDATEALYPSYTTASRIQGVKDSDPDILIIMGGTNDYSYQNPIGTDAEYALALGSKDKHTFKGAYSFLIETFLAWKPTLEIIIIGEMQTSYRDEYTITQKEYADASESVAINYALPFINAYKESGISKFNAATYTTDGIHPNDAGGKKIANLVISKLKNLYNV